jgi:hypothetical protein
LSNIRGRIANVLLVVLTLLSIGAIAAEPAPAAGATPTLTLYTVATGVQFINTADDRARGATNNPFNPETNKLRPRVSDTGSGPFPGDVAVYSFNVYGNATLKRSLGSASYTCYFNYTRHALCQAYYQLRGGTLTAAGPVDFNATSFKLVLTGGTKGYLSARGQVTSVKSLDNAQRVDFRMLG